MKKTVDIDLVIDPSEEAKICVNCKKVKCSPTQCLRYSEEKKKLKQGRKKNEKG